MKQIFANLVNGLTNLHVSVPVIGAAALAIAPIWFPQYADRLHATAAVLAVYGVIASANTPPDKLTPKS